MNERTAGKPRRPYVICHMMASLDGRIVADGWPELGEGWGEYERTGSTFEADGWLCGRITLAPVADGTVGAPSLFDMDRPGPDQAARRLALESVERRADDVLWLRYRVEPS